MRSGSPEIIHRPRITCHQGFTGQGNQIPVLSSKLSALRQPGS
ncbi:hypothetical protein PCH70_48690 [Pseudomonas cichorii JBC1]|nr:hypothetical protein PCH70_48690 [Pseudomonas cichorii JBC1]